MSGWDQRYDVDGQYERALANIRRTNRFARKLMIGFAILEFVLAVVFYAQGNDVWPVMAGASVYFVVMAWLNHRIVRAAERRRR